jgi:PemK-like, MazF-like toxin of type II toxin-antitoxin system
VPPLDLRSELAELARPFLGRQVTYGDVWRACPREAGATIHAMCEDTSGKEYVGMKEARIVREGQLAERGEGAVTEWVKIFIRRSSMDVVPRPGVALSRDSRWGRTVLAPSYTGEPKDMFPHLPRVIVDWPPGSPARTSKKITWSRFHLWGLWGMSATPGVEIISLLEHISNGTLASGLDLGAADPAARASGLLAELLGLSSPSWIRPKDVSRVRACAVYRRGEIVAVRISPAGPHPCLVVSDDGLNGTHSGRLVVAQLIPYRDRHDSTRTVVPVKQTLGGRQWSAALTLLRGIDRARGSRFIASYDPRVFVADDVFSGEIGPALKDMYGSP